MVRQDAARPTSIFQNTSHRLTRSLRLRQVLVAPTQVVVVLLDCYQFSLSVILLSGTA